MKKNVVIRGKKIYLRTLRLSDVSGRYVSFLKDNDVSKYLTVNPKTVSFQNVSRYVSEKRERRNCLLLGIFIKNSNLHIGNIKLEPIDSVNRKVEVGIMIGDKSCWGKGYGTEVLTLAVQYIFRKMKMEKVTLGVFADNVRAIHLYKKCGFTIEGILRHDEYTGRKFIDRILMSILKKEYIHQSV